MRDLPFKLTGKIGFAFFRLGLGYEKSRVNIGNFLIFLIGIEIFDYFSAENGDQYPLQNLLKCLNKNKDLTNS